MTFAVHNAVQLVDAEVRDRFVVRNRELGELLAHLREPDPPRHALVIGQRGMGKSLLLRRVAVTVADEPDLADRWLPVVMPEELYEVTSTGELWLAALAHLAATMADADLAAQHAALLAEPDPMRLATLALERLLTAARSRGRKILLLAENLDMLLDDQVAADDGWALRSALQTEPDLLLIGSAVTSFSRLESSGEAFYGFFHRIDLGPLGDDDVRALWHKVTGVELAGDRIVPIRILTGGNPRLVSVLGRFSQRGDLSSLRQDLELLIDEYTPYFKANIEILPATERKVFVTLADIWAPATAAEVAQKARMTSSQVSALLGRLVRRGAVQPVDAGGSRQHYELTERLYNLYHLLRRSGGEGRVRALVDILIHLYGTDELERDVLPAIVGLTSSPIDTSVASQLSREIDGSGLWDDMRSEERQARLPILRSLLASQRAKLGDDHEDTLFSRQQVACIVASVDPSSARHLAWELLHDQRRVLGPDHPDIFPTRFLLAECIGRLGHAEGALAMARQNAADAHDALGPDHRYTLCCRIGLGLRLGAAGNARDAATALEQIASDFTRLGSNHPDAFWNRYWLAYYARESGDTAGALRAATSLVQEAEAALGPTSRVLHLARQMHANLVLATAEDSRVPLPREWRDALKPRPRTSHAGA